MSIDSVAAALRQLQPFEHDPSIVIASQLDGRDVLPADPICTSGRQWLRPTNHSTGRASFDQSQPRTGLVQPITAQDKPHPITNRSTGRDSSDQSQHRTGLVQPITAQDGPDPANDKTGREWTRPGSQLGAVIEAAWGQVVLVDTGSEWASGVSISRSGLILTNVRA
jgi:hypothetical protein